MLIYTQSVNFESDDYHSAVARTVNEAQKLVEDGFQFVCQIGESTLFRKRKQCEIVVWSKYQKLDRERLFTSEKYDLDQPAKIEGKICI